MCTICGCDDQAMPTSQETAHAHAHPHGHDLSREHSHVHATQPHADEQIGDLHYGLGPAGVTVPGLSQARAIRIEQDVLGANKRLAQDNRRQFQARSVLALNLVSSPGSGKTTLLCATIGDLCRRAPELAPAVIEGDQQTAHDAERIRATGAPAIQVNTGKGCHLDAAMVGQAYARLGKPQGLLFIENVGNLVCPAMWDLGEAAKVVILSVTEGEDKPLKYPDMFAAARLMIITKIDLLPYLRFDLERCVAYARQVNPAIEVLQLSAESGVGMDNWIGWLRHEWDHLRGHAHGHDHSHGPGPLGRPAAGVAGFVDLSAGRG